MGDRTRGLSSLNPLRVSGTALPPNALLAAKIVTIVFLAAGDGLATLPGHFLPFVSVFLHAGSPALFKHVLQAIFVVAAIGLLLNRWVRTNCFVMSAVVLVVIASSRLWYSNNRLYFALLLLIIALYDRRVGTRILRYQLAVLYAGAAANKLLQTDWRDGAFVQNWLPHYFSGYSHIAGALPHMLLSGALGWIAMLTEATLAVLLLIPRFVPTAAWLGLAYHTGLTTITAHTFGMFWYAMLASYVMLMPWPAAPVGVSFVAHNAWQRRLARGLSRLDIENNYQCRSLPIPRLLVEKATASFVGPGAWVRLVLYLPVVYLVFASLLATISPARALIPAVLLLLAALALPPKRQLSRSAPARPSEALDAAR